MKVLSGKWSWSIVSTFAAILLVASSTAFASPFPEQVETAICPVVNEIPQDGLGIGHTFQGPKQQLAVTLNSVTDQGISEPSLFETAYSGEHGETRVLTIDFSIQNLVGYALSISPMNFWVEDSFGFHYEYQLYTGARAWNRHQIRAGSVRRGELRFRIPADAQMDELLFVYSMEARPEDTENPRIADGEPVAFVLVETAHQ